MIHPTPPSLQVKADFRIARMAFFVMSSIQQQQAGPPLAGQNHEIPAQRLKMNVNGFNYDILNY